MQYADKLVVFDLDGTLNRTDLFAVDAHLTALREYGRTDVWGELVAATFGAAWQDYMKVLLPDADPATWKAYLARVAELEVIFMKERGAPFAGAEQMLSDLRGYGFALRFAPMRRRGISRRSKRWADAPDRLHTAACCRHEQKGHLRLLLARETPAKAVMVGDRCYDLEAARANGIPFIGCLYGFNPEEVKTADKTVCTLRNHRLCAATAGSMTDQSHRRQHRSINLSGRMVL
ncbi:MAG: HAD family hydrolase [Oscillospiraceae bacterium]